MQPPDRSGIIVERILPHSPEKIWRALTEPHLMAEWLMKTNFVAQIGHRFDFRADWGSVQCEVLAIEPNKSLSYRWGDHVLNTVVTWTLTPTAGGTLLRMEQTGFAADQPRYYHGAKAGWPRFLDTLETLLSTSAQGWQS